MLNVLQVTPALDAGGVERTTLEVAQAIVEAGGRALVASAGGRLEGELAALGGELVRLDMDNKNPLRIRANADRLAQIARAEGVRLIHARSRAPGWSALWAARKLGLPFVTTYHGIYNARSPLKRLYNSVMARGDIVIANSDYTRAHVIAEHALAPERIVTIPRGVDLKAFDPERVSPERIEAARADLGFDGSVGRLRVILPARLTRWKGQLLLIEAAAILAARGMPIRVALAGDAQGRSAYEEELKRALAGAGLADATTLPGHVADMPAVLAAADLAVFPSLEPEAFGRGAVEAQAMGKPLVAAAHGGLAETVLDGETGLLVPPGDAQALAEAIAQIAALSPDARRTMGEKGRARVTARYSTKALQSATLAVYRRLLSMDPA